MFPDVDRIEHKTLIISNVSDVIMSKKTVGGSDCADREQKIV